MRRPLIIILLIQFALSANAQEKRGYIDPDTSIQYLQGYRKEGKKLELMKRQIEDSINIMLMRLDSTINSNKQGDLDSNEIKELLEMLYAGDELINKYRENANARLAKEKELVKEKLKEELATEMERFAAGKKIKLIKDVATFNNCEDCIDYTGQFIKYLKKK